MKLSRVVMLLCVLMLNGCMTFTDLGLANGAKKDRIYGGVRASFEEGLGSGRGGRRVGMLIFRVIDIPLCVVADTIVLPYTILVWAVDPGYDPDEDGTQDDAVEYQH